MANLYRKSAIEKLSSPEQLDKALKITSPLSWVALIGITIIIVVVLSWSIKGTLPTTLEAKGIIVKPDSISAQYCTEVGDVRTVKVKKGANIEVGDPLVVIKKRSGEEITLYATASGKITDILVKYWDEINKGDQVLRFTPNTDESQLVALYVPATDINKIKTGMQVDIFPTAYDSQKYGHMEAVVYRIEEYPVDIENMKYILGTDNQLVNEFTKEGTVYQVLCVLTHDDNTLSGYWWSTENSKELIISDSTIVKGKIIVDESAPITKLIPEFVNN